MSTSSVSFSQNEEILLTLYRQIYSHLLYAILLLIIYNDSRNRSYKKTE